MAPRPPSGAAPGIYIRAYNIGRYLYYDILRDYITYYDVLYTDHNISYWFIRFTRLTRYWKYCFIESLDKF